MRWHLACLALLFARGALATPVPPGGAGPVQRSPATEEAPPYAERVLFAVQEIAENYVRPVTRKELIGAAVAGLYEAARVPLPSTFATELARSKNDSDLNDLLIRARTELGDPEPLRGDGALLASLRGMTRLLDPYSGVITGEELRRNSGSGPASGLGLELVEHSVGGPVLIKAVLPGGPAQRAGIRPGDEVTHLNGRPVHPDDLIVLAQLRLHVPRPGDVPPSVPIEHVTLGLRRPGVKETLKVKLEPRSFRPETVFGVTREESNTWHYWIDRERKIAHVRLGSLEDGTAQELKEVLARLQGAGLRGLLLDLRWCPGGFLNEALDVAQVFLGECTVASVKSRGQGDDTYRSVRDDSKVLDLPVVVLVGPETSGGAELIAAALQDNGRATVAGQRTRGKASIQTTSGLPVPKIGLKLTSGTFYRPSGKNLHRFPDSKPGDDWGVRPEPKLEFRASAELNRQLKEWWEQQTLRPGSSREALPLDDPKADPQRQAALQALIGMIK